MHIYIVLTGEIHQDYIAIIIFVLTIYYKEFNALYVSQQKEESQAHCDI